MTACAPDRRRLVLRCPDRRWGELLSDRVAVDLTSRLINRLAADGAGGSNVETATAGVRCLAQSSAPLAAWLLDHLTCGARQDVSQWAAAAAHDRFALDSRLASLPHADLLEWFSHSLELCHVAWPQAEAWRVGEARARAVAERAVALARAQGNSKLSSEVGWWTLYLTSPVGTLEPAQDAGWTWTLRPPAPLPDMLAHDHWLSPVLELVRRAQVELVLPSDPSPEGQPVEEQPSEGHADRWRTLLPPLLQMARRCARLEHRFHEAVEREKLLAMKELAYGASHEINNPLANISSRAQLLLRDEADPERRRSLATINSQAFRAHEMIADMMLFAKPPALQCQTIHLEPFLEQWLDRFAADLPPGVTLERTLELGPSVCRCDPAQIAEVLRAIASNALEAMGDSGQLRFSAQVACRDTGRPLAELTLIDSGPGISPEVLPRLFDPFFSGREAGRGLGFGLSKAWRIIDLHGGQLAAASPPGSGAVLTVRLPLAE